MINEHERKSDGLEIPKIFSPVKPNTVLMDKRIGHHGLTFGTIENIAKQYGIAMKEVDKGCVFSAPKSRLQMFVEKLHFANIGYKLI